jgi:glutamyl-tRNA synthetase
LYEALAAIGIGTGPPAFGHLPFVLGDGNRKLSKRDPESNLLGYREAGYVPEGLLNYLALLGWAIAEDRDIFSLDEMVDAFDIARVNPNPARFDPKKCEAINATHLRLLDGEEFARRLTPYLRRAGLLGAEPVADVVDERRSALLAAAAPLVQERVAVLGEAVDMLAFLFVEDEAFTVDSDDAAKILDEQGLETVRAARDALATLDTWQTPAIEDRLREALVEGLGRKPRLAFGPVRVAVTGKRVSPPLFESLELLGRDRSLARLAAVLS